jgi:plastocyanin
MPRWFRKTQSKAMRLVALILLTLTFVGCNKPDKANPENGEAHDDPELADPSESLGRREPVRHVVEIVQMKFVPDVLNVHQGDTVIWMNKDLVQHDVTELNTKLWSSSRLAAGASWKMVFTKSQVYYCSLHLVMKGKIIVDGNDIAMTNVSSEITMCGSDKEVVRKVAAN